MSALELWVHGADLSPARCPQQVKDGEELSLHLSDEALAAQLTPIVDRLLAV